MLSGSSPIDKLLPLLRGVKKTPNGWDAICPAHDDSKASLGVAIGKDGKVLLNCRSQHCEFKRIVEATGLTEQDFFQSNGTHERNGHASKLGPVAAAYDYRDEAGKLLYQVCRYEPPGDDKTFRQRRPDGKGGWTWKLEGVRRVPYRLTELLADPSAAVFIVEGEKDADALAALDLLATTNAQGAGKFGTLNAATIKEAFAGRAVYIIPDNDEPGRQHALDVARRLQAIAATIRIVTLPNLPDKGDVSDWLAAGHDRGELIDLAEVAGEWRQADDADADTDADNPPSAEPDKPSFSFRWEPVESAAFFAADYRPDWIIENVVVERQPLLIGGPQKVLKTSIALDLAISVASATPVLGMFPVRHARKVAILSGESGPYALQSIGRRICEAKGIDPASLGGNLTWQFRLPQLAVKTQLLALADGLKRDKPDVVIIDPLYLSLLAGSEARAENLFDTGPLLLEIAQVCDGNGATPWLLHHAPKPVARKCEPMELTDLAFSGTAEFARQWLLISRREPYEPGSGQHLLWLVIGGSVGHNGLYAADVDEGQLGVDFGGRKWEVSIATGTEAKKSLVGEKEAAKHAAALKRDAADDQAVMTAIDREGNGEPVSYTRVRALAGLNNDRMTRSIDRLKRTGLLAEAPCIVGSGTGNKAKKPARGLRRKQKDNGGTDGTNTENPAIPPLTNGGTGLPASIEAVPSPTITSAESDQNQESEAVPPLVDGDTALFAEPSAGVYGGGL